jgi:exopolyphosphatase/guanosine-5'-triphosphate,3'-diphosphate pyrophosphatase
MEAKLIGSIDIGTNSVLLLITIFDGKRLRRFVDEATITRLGQGVDALGKLSEEAIDRTLQCLQNYADKLSERNVTIRGAVATSAMRDAENGTSFLDRAETILGVRPQVVSGELEAQLTCDGALSGLEPEGKLTVFDVGGGSTEIVACTRIGNGVATLRNAVSLPMGAVRMTERHLKSDPPRAEELLALRSDVRKIMKDAPNIAGRALIGVAGTVTTLAALIHNITPYDGNAVHGCLVGRDALSQATDELASITINERKQLEALDPKRADVIVAGAIIVDEICDAAGMQRLLVSDRGVRWGLAQRLSESNTI